MTKSQEKYQTTTASSQPKFDQLYFDKLFSVVNRVPNLKTLCSHYSTVGLHQQNVKGQRMHTGKPI